MILLKTWISVRQEFRFTNTPTGWVGLCYTTSNLVQIYRYS